MEITDCTPPDDLPSVIIVTMTDREYRADGPCYWLRVAAEDGSVESHDLQNVTLPGAVREAEALGHSPTHYVDKRGYVWRIPSGIKRKLG